MLGNLIKSKMELMGVDRHLIAERLGVNLSTISRKFKNDNFSVKEFKILIKTLNISNNEIIKFLRR